MARNFFPIAQEDVVPDVNDKRYDDLTSQISSLTTQLNKQQSIQNWLNQSRPYNPPQYTPQQNTWLNSFNYQMNPFVMPSGVGPQNSLSGNQVTYGGGLLGANQYAQSQGAK